MYFNIVQPLVLKELTRLHQHHFVRWSSFGENAHKSKPHGIYIFGSNFVYVCVLFLTLSSHWCEKGDEASPSIILAGQGLLVKMLLIILEQHGTCTCTCIFGSNFVYL